MRYLLLILLSGCSILQPKPEKVAADDFVIVPCVDQAPAHPEFVTDEQLRAMNAPEFVTALHIDRNRRMIYISDLEAIVAGCR
jgi:hypothetical protein